MTGFSNATSSPSAPLPAGVPTSAAHFLACVEALTAEIRIALAAIAANDLLTLTDSICRQEDVCAQLERMPRPSAAVLRSGNVGRIWAEQWGALESRIETAVETLRQISTEYSLVLEASSRSIGLLASLCRGYSGEVRPIDSVRSKTPQGGSGRRTWSCEA